MAHRQTGATPFPLNADDVWVEILRPRAGAPAPALFVDRDGTLIEEVDFLQDPEQVRVLPGVARAIVAARSAGWLTVLAANQSGIGRGLFDWAEFAAVQKTLLNKLDRESATFDAVLACPHHPEALGRFAHPAHPARKPAAGMLLTAATRLPIDLRRSVIVGDRCSDMAAGRAAGLAAGFIVRTGYGARQCRDALQMQTPDFRVQSLPSLAAWRPELIEMPAKQPRSPKTA